MNYVLYTVTLVSGLLLTVTLQAQDSAPAKGPGTHVVYQQDDIVWQPAPASLKAGAQLAVLEGNPAEAGVFTMRIKLPDGYTIPPHWHPNVERVTVFSGVFNLGTGETMDRETTHALTAGSYTSMPAEMRHYVYAEGETVVQVTSIGPWAINYVNAKDDPRQQK